MKKPRVIGGVFTCLIALVCGGSLASAADSGPVKPDLVPILPATVRPTQSAPVYVDAFIHPHHLEYRFDAVIFNRGGALDMFRDPSSGKVVQAIWPNGVPAATPQPTQPPSGTGLTLEPRTGAKFKYVFGHDHNHFHLQAAAKYVLRVPGLGELLSAKVGFCLEDDWGTPTNQYYPAGMGWCGRGQPKATFFREGISPNSGDLYNSQIDAQWIDVSGLRAGSYTLSSTVNPLGFIDESNRSNNILNVRRQVPGVLVPTKVLPADARSVQVTGQVVAPGIPARTASTCFPRSGGPACLTTDPPGGGSLRFRLLGQPCHGHASISGTGKAATVTFSGSSGGRSNGVAYVATDRRGLTSVPGYIRFGSPSRSGASSACLLGGNVGPDHRARLEFATAGARPPAGTHWGLFVDSRYQPSTLRGSTVTSRKLSSGRTLFWIELVNKTGQPLSPRVQSREIVLYVQ